MVEASKHDLNFEIGSVDLSLDLKTKNPIIDALYLRV